MAIPVKLATILCTTALLTSIAFTQDTTKETKAAEKARRKAEAAAPVQVDIAAPAEIIKTQLVRVMMRVGCKLDADTTLTISFTCQPRDGEAALAVIGMGNRYSDWPVKHIRYVFLPGASAVSVNGEASISVTMASGRINSHDDNSPKTKDWMRAVILTAKSNIESAAVTPPAAQ